MKKLFFLVAIFLLTGVGCASRPDGNLTIKNQSEEKNVKDYNVVIFAFDGLQAKHLHSYGYELATTPNLDKFLEKSYLFKNNVSPSSWTVPSFMSIFTSLYPSEHKVVNKFVEYSQVGTTTKAVKANLKQLNPEAVTLAEILKKNGYATAGFTGDAGVSAAFGSAQGFDEYYDKDAFGGFDTSTPLAEKWLEKNKDNKFFLFVHGYDVHGQNTPRAGFDYRYVDKSYSGKYSGSAAEQGKLREENLANGKLNLSVQDQVFWRAIYDEKINRADQEFGDFMKKLKDLGLEKNTIIITISDHGTEFFEHGGIDHGHTLYSELLNTLFAVHMPGQSEGRTVNDLVSTIDLAPTVLRLANISDPDVSSMKGVDLTPAFSGEKIAHDVYSETDYRLYTHKRSVTTVDGWKFIMTMENGEKELYNLNKDPDERVNLIKTDNRIAYELEQKLINHLRSMGAADGPWPIGCLPVYGDQCQNLNTPTSTVAESQKKNLKSPDSNIVLINIDSLRADHMGVYGYKKNTTPFLDSLFKQGVVFEQAITPAILTFQTDAAIFSGLYPSQNNIQSWDNQIKPELDLLPRILGIYGYHTAAFVSPSLWETFGMNKQFDEYQISRDVKNIKNSKLVVADWLKKQDQPFFLFWHVYDVHLPFIAPGPEFYSGKYQGVFSNLKTLWFWEEQSPTEISVKINSSTFGTVHKFTGEDYEYLKAGYDAGIKYTDSELKKFFDGIKKEPWYKNTIFVISSEHGEDLKEHGFLFHRDLYDVNTRVPLAILGPGFEPKRISEAVSSLDILPTILGAIGGVVPASAEGSDLSDLISGVSLNRDIYTERPPYDEYAVRSGNWKYILRNPDKLKAYDTYEKFMQRMIKNEVVGGDELYDLSKDPGEQSNLIGKGLDVEKVLRDKLIKFREKMTKAREINKTIDKVVPHGGKYIPYP